MIKAVEVDIPGCSFNPDLEQHQDAVAEAVAAEMSKVYAREHLPVVKKIFNHMPEVDELEALLVRTSSGREGSKARIPCVLQMKDKFR